MDLVGEKGRSVLRWPLSPAQVVYFPHVSQTMFTCRNIKNNAIFSWRGCAHFHLHIYPSESVCMLQNQCAAYTVYLPLSVSDYSNEIQWLKNRYICKTLRSQCAALTSSAVFKQPLEGLCDCIHSMSLKNNFFFLLSYVSSLSKGIGHWFSQWISSEQLPKC